jgi:hypothetical protein
MLLTIFYCDGIFGCYNILRLSKKRGQFETDTVIDIQAYAYFQLYLFRTGDA